MELFLADYGLMWVGHNENEPIEEDNENIIVKNISYADFAIKVAELNDIVLSEPTKIVMNEGTTRKARFAHPQEVLDNIKVTFYKNGLMIKSGPFRDINSDSYNSFVQDIMDGYFPSEFREQSPDGVLLDLIDRHNDVYDSNADSNNTVRKDQFLKKMSATTILKNGEVYNPRNDVLSRLQPNDNCNSSSSSSSNNSNTLEKGKQNGNEVTLTTKQCTYLTTDISQRLLSSSELLLGEEYSTVQIKILGGHGKDPSVLILKTTSMDSIANIRNSLKIYLNNITEDIEIKSLYPTRILRDNETLRDAGLVPNGTVHVKIIN
jgi:hypothetical protein